MRIEHLEFVAGPKPGEKPLNVKAPTVTVLVGPNNSGKSVALREIEDWCCNVDRDFAIISDIQVSFPEKADDAVRLVKEYRTDPPENQVEAPDHCWIGIPTFRQSQPVIHEQVNLQAVENAATEKQSKQLRQYLSRLYTIRLDGRTRFTLSDPKPTGDLQSHPQNHLWSLFQNDAARAQVREITQEAFDLYFVIDPTSMNQFRVRMSSTPPVSKSEEQSLDSEARAFHKKAPLISNLSDGVQAFTGLVSAVASFPHQIILVDEPEAFLHPPLARRLGKHLARIAVDRSASMLTATHSAEFLMGCIESSPDTEIIRVTYENGVATARAIERENLQALMHDPLLRSTDALRGLFHRSVIVTEADRDRTFYDEINFRLQGDKSAVEDCLFLNAQNWQTIPRITKPLRSIGIPAAAIMDLDVVASRQGWDSIYEMMSLTDSQANAMETERAKLREKMLKLPKIDGKPAYKVKGIKALRICERKGLKNFLERVSEFGLFVVPVGEVEHWLGDLGLDAVRKKDWLTTAFDALGADPNDPGYVNAASDDVWDFLRSISTWVADPERKGIP